MRQHLNTYAPKFAYTAFFITGVALTFCGFFFTVPKVYAVTTTLTDIPSPIPAGKFSLTVTIDGAGDGTNYLKLEFFKEDQTSYFGETFNGTEWYSGSEYTSYPSITVSDGQWSGTIEGRVENEDIDPQAHYYARIRRYTSSGNYNSNEAKASAVAVLFPIIPSTTPVATLEAPTFTPAPTFLPPTIVPTFIPLNEIYLSEAFVYPQSGENEWIELYNNNDFDVTLENWFLDDIENAGSTPRAFSLSIHTKGYAVIEIPSAMFNNSGDAVRLLDNLKHEKDSFSYTEAQKDISFGESSPTTTTVCLQYPSKGMSNTTCLADITVGSSTEITETPTIATFLSTSPIESLDSIISPTSLLSPFQQENIEAITPSISSHTQPNVLGATTSSQSSLSTIMYVLLILSILANLSAIAYSGVQIRNTVSLS